MSSAARNSRVLPLAPPQMRRSRPRDHVVRAFTAIAVARARAQHEAATDIAEQLWGDESETQMLIRAMSSPALTTTPNWAGSLAGIAIADFFDSLPNSVFAALRRLGINVLNAKGEPIRIPGVTGPMQQAIFVGQGDALPVFQGVVGGPILATKKIAAILVGSLELFSVANAETVMRTLLDEAVVTGLDAVLLGSAAASPTSPGGLLNGVVPVTPSDATDPTVAMKADLVAMANALAADSSADIVIAANKTEALMIALSAPTMNVIATPALPPGSAVMIDARAFATTGTGVPEVDTSELAAVHLANPAAPLIEGAPATPITSLWQQAMLGLRILMPVDWGLRAPGHVSAVTGANW